MFFDLDRNTGMPRRTTYESMRAGLWKDYPLASGVPDHIRDHLLTAVDFISLAYEQANLDRPHLFGALTDAGLRSGLLALELALKHRLGIGPDARMTLGQAIGTAKKRAVLPAGPESEALWNQVLDVRNQLAHGDKEAPVYGISAGRLLGLLIGAINRLF
jgi:hypothetical protein